MAGKDSRGLWLALSALELNESHKIAEMLKPFHRPVEDCYECGVEVPTLSGKREKEIDISVTAIFLKRLLNDLRATWNLLLLGYTSQAGSVAAAAFENAMIINCLACNIEKTEKILASKSGEPPWSVKDMCTFYTRHLNEEAKKSGKISDEVKDEAYREVLYSQYKWLCKIKHPTIPSVLHDAFSVSLTGDEYIIMAAPDVREEDLPSKAFIITVTVLRVKEAIDSFALARELNYENTSVTLWKGRLDSIIPNLDKAVTPVMKMPLPFNYRGYMLKRK
jgi:hypothetical protein